MREIVNLQIGGCGNQIGNKFWEAICQEHGIDKNGEFKGESDLQFQRLNVFFNQSNKGRYTSRAIITDLQPGVADSIRAGPFAALFDSENYVLGQNGAGNNWAKGYYTDGSELSSSILDVIRKEAEECDHLQGFQVLHSLGGGTGSGLGSLLIQKIKQEYSDKIIANFSVFPSQKVSDTIVQPYNATFSTSGLIYNSDFSVVIDNQNLFNICSDILKISKPTYGDLNHLISTVMTGITCCLRFPGQLNSDLRKLAVNLIPFPRQHFFSVGFAPFIYKGSEMYRSLSVLQLSQQMFLDPKVVMCSADPRHGRYFTGSAIFRGNFSTHQIEQQMRNILNKNSSYFMQWIPNNIKYSLCKVSSKAHKNSVTFLGNSTATQQVFKKTIQNFNSMYRRRAFVHWYTNQGLQQTQFTEAQSNLNDLISEHQQYVDYTGQQYNEEQFQDW